VGLAEYKVVCRRGQSRSGRTTSRQQYIRSGKWGKVHMAKGLEQPAPPPREPRQGRTPPKGLDWNIWQGPGTGRPTTIPLHHVR